jgi:hypothetical protein
MWVVGAVFLAGGTFVGTTLPVAGTSSSVAGDDEVVAGEVTVLADEYSLGDTTGWKTAAVFELTNEGDGVTAVPYRVKVHSPDGGTNATSDGTDAVFLGPEETVTLVLDELEPTGDSAPTQGEVTVYSRTGQAAEGVWAEPDWVSSNEAFDCDNGLVGCGFTGDLTFDGAGPGTPERIQVVAYRGDEIVAAGHTTTEVPDVVPGNTIPHAGQLAAAPGFDGTAVTDVRVAVKITSYGD